MFSTEKHVTHDHLFLSSSSLFFHHFCKCKNCSLSDNIPFMPFLYTACLSPMISKRDEVSLTHFKKEMAVTQERISLTNASRIRRNQEKRSFSFYKQFSLQRDSKEKKTLDERYDERWKVFFVQ